MYIKVTGRVTISEFSVVAYFLRPAARLGSGTADAVGQDRARAGLSVIDRDLSESRAVGRTVQGLTVV